MNNNQKDKEINLYKENYLLNSVFIKDIDFQYIYKKTEKIVTAIYLVTNFLATEEPLKWSLRNSSTSLLKSAMTFSKVSLSDREIRIHDLNSSILETSSFFDLAYRSGFVTTMNYEVINYEVSKLAASVAGYQSESISSNKGLFDEDYFNVSENLHTDLYENYKNLNQNNLNNIKDKTNKDNNNSNKGQNVNKGHNNNVFNKTFGSNTSGESISSKNSNENKYQSQISKNNSLENSLYESKGQNNLINKNAKPPKRKSTRNKKTNVERRNLIIAEIRKQGEVSVKDIAKIMSDVSEKTLQRELISMVDEKIIVKKGERRWSRYSI